MVKKIGTAYLLIQSKLQLHVIMIGNVTCERNKVVNIDVLYSFLQGQRERERSTARDEYFERFYDDA